MSGTRNPKSETRDPNSKKKANAKPIGSMTYAAMGGGGRAGAGADFSTFNEFKKGDKQDPRCEGLGFRV